METKCGIRGSNGNWTLVQCGGLQVEYVGDVTLISLMFDLENEEVSWLVSQFACGNKAYVTDCSEVGERTDGEKISYNVSG